MEIENKKELEVKHIERWNRHCLRKERNSNCDIDDHLDIMKYHKKLYHGTGIYSGFVLCDDCFNKLIDND